MSYAYERIRTTLEEGVLTAVLDNPPINLLTIELFREMAAFIKQVAQDPHVRVLVVKSADPDFWIAHFDVQAILGFPVERDPLPVTEPGAFHAMCERVRKMPAVTIAQIEGRAGGGGNEFLSGFDMRFGTPGCRFNQMEVPLGILPGGSGTQRLPRLVGRNRALEMILGGDDLDAETAERWGYLNRVLPADRIDAWVRRLARRIASFPEPAVRAAKAAVNASDLPLEAGLAEEQRLFRVLLGTPEARQNMQRFLELGGQTRDGELEVGALSERLGTAPD